MSHPTPDPMTVLGEIGTAQVKAIMATLTAADGWVPTEDVNGLAADPLFYDLRLFGAITTRFKPGGRGKPGCINAYAATTLGRAWWAEQ